MHSSVRFESLIWRSKYGGGGGRRLFIDFHGRFSMLDLLLHKNSLYKYWVSEGNLL